MLGLAGALELGQQAFNLASDVASRNYQKRLQERAWEREDNAVQRRVADLKAAGLNPVLAAGSAASSSSPITLPTPEISGNAAEMGANVAHTVASKKLADMQTESVNNAMKLTKQEVVNKQLEAMNIIKTGSLLDQQALKASSERRAVDLSNKAEEFSQKYWQDDRGIPTNASGWTKELSTGGSVLTTLGQNLSRGLVGPALGALHDLQAAAGRVFAPRAVQRLAPGAKPSESERAPAKGGGSVSR